MSRTKWSVEYDEGALNGASSDQVKYGELIVKQLAQTNDPRAFSDKSGARVEALNHNLAGSYKFKPGKEARYGDEKNTKNIRIVFSLYENLKRLFRTDTTECRSERKMVVHRIAHRDCVYEED